MSLELSPHLLKLRLTDNLLKDLMSLDQAVSPPFFHLPWIYNLWSLMSPLTLPQINNFYHDISWSAYETSYAWIV
ncbi:hypothetical protein GDO81_001089 [Engystomops pustulosus]|uniref:Uncharacterized protein n=1 Tax=Engystomops pustulosus TaxID=76066 RepID=A0AAV7DDH4_ENGPU|nr:hypothetical protein GDO81_001089 [Engystomops pustulosus]